MAAIMSRGRRVKAWMSDYLPRFCMDVITDPCLNLDTNLELISVGEFIETSIEIRAWVSNHIHVKPWDVIIAGMDIFGKDELISPFDFGLQ